MQSNQISQELTATELSSALSIIQNAIDVLTPHMATLTAEERKEIAKMSDKTVAFVTKTVNYCNTNPEFTPSYLSLDELKKDLNLVNVLKQLLDKATQLCQALEDTTMLAGSEAYLAALMYYNSVKGAAKQGVMSAEPIYNDLAERFPSTNRGKKFQQVNK